MVHFLKSLLGICILPVIYAYQPRIPANSRALCRTITMTDTLWTKCKIIGNQKDASGLKLVQIDAGSDIAGKYTNPGQYVQMRPNQDSKANFYAIASPPGSQPLTFLIKESESNSFLTSASVGSTVEVGSPMGKVSIKRIRRCNLTHLSIRVSFFKNISTSINLIFQLCKFYLWHVVVVLLL